MEDENNGTKEFLSIDKFISELMGYHEQIKQLQASEVRYKLLSATLQESLNQYRTVVDLLPQKVFLKDKNSSYPLANESYARALGVSRELVVGKADYDLFPAEKAGESLKEDQEAMATGIPVHHEDRHAGEGGFRVERVVKFPVKDGSGETSGILGISWDITDQKAREEELEKKNLELAGLLGARDEELREIRAKLQGEQSECRRLGEKLRDLETLYGLLFENTGTAVAIVAENRVIARVNPEFERLSGHSRAEVEGMKSWDDFVLDGRAENAGGATPSADLTALSPGKQVLKIQDRQTREKAVSMSAARIPGTDRIMVFLTDITGYTLAREELDRALKQFTKCAAEMESGVRGLDG
jgi:PAS domain S-box-containing protein